MNLQTIKPYLTVKNIVMFLIVIGLIILLFALFKSRPEPIENTAVLDVLKEQNKSLLQENELLKTKAVEQKRQDSIKIAYYQSQTEKDARIIYIYKTKRDEKNNLIDTAGDAELRRILTEK